MLNMFSNIVASIQRQLESQIEVDSVLATARNKCPQVLIDFFLLERAFNRDQCKRVSESKAWDYPNVVARNMRDLESRNQALFECSQGSNICEMLRSYNIGHSESS